MAKWRARGWRESIHHLVRREALRRKPSRRVGEGSGRGTDDDGGETGDDANITSGPTAPFEKDAQLTTTANVNLPARAGAARNLPAATTPESVSTVYV